MKKYFEQYLAGELDAISLIRMMSGMFDPDHAVSLLTFICAITRMEQGDLDHDTFREIYLKEKDAG